jgi:hypothetical protein
MVKNKKSSKPKSIDDLDIGMSTMAMVSDENKYTNKDPNVYHGTYKGKKYVWTRGQAKLAPKGLGGFKGRFKK